MKMKKAAIIAVAILLVLLVSGGCLLVVYEVNRNQKEAAKAFELLDIKKYEGVLGNIIYLGLEDTAKKEIKE